MIYFYVEISGIYQPCTIRRSDTQDLWSAPVEGIARRRNPGGSGHVPQNVHPLLWDTILAKGLIVAIPDIEKWLIGRSRHTTISGTDRACSVKEIIHFGRKARRRVVA